VTKNILYDYDNNYSDLFVLTTAYMLQWFKTIHFK